MDTATTKTILTLIDENPYVLQSSVEHKKEVEALIDKGLVTYGKCGCSLPSVHVTKQGRAFLKEYTDQ